MLIALIVAIFIIGFQWFVIGLLKDENNRLREEIGGSDFEQKEP